MREGAAMKDLTLSVVGVLALALAMGLAFHWLYPLVEVGANLAGLFVFVALVLKLALARIWTSLHKPRTAPGGEVAK
jgi:hypothetical protein